MFFYNSEDNIVITNSYEAFNRPEIFNFYFYDKEFSKTDWTQEPSKTLDELYLERARSIRDRYEYLILCYSGGYDSSNILETFYYNNIHIDEILLVGAFSQDSHFGSDENHNGEIYKQCIPTLNKMRLPNTKITQVDYTRLFDNIENFTLIKQYGSNWIKHIGQMHSVHNLFWSDLKKFVGRDNDKKTGVIFGVEKPNFHYENNKAFTYFVSNYFYQYGSFNETMNFKKINFYTDVDTTDLMKKQLHIIYKFYVKSVLIDKFITHDFFMRNYNKIIHQLIYKLRDPITFISTKSPSNILSLRDCYLLSNKNSAIYNIYIDGLKKSGVFYFYRNDHNRFAPLGSSFKSRNYYLTNDVIGF